MRNRYLSSFLFSLLSTAIFANGLTAQEIDTYMRKMFEYAQARDLRSLEDLEKDVNALHSSTLTFAYSLALYIAAPDKYEKQYVDKFPTDSVGINDLYAVELKQLTPKGLYSIHAIGDIAMTGNERAMEKVFKGAAHSDGGVAEEFCDYVGKLLGKRLKEALIALSQIEVTERKKSYSCFELMEAKDFLTLKKKIRKETPTSPKVKQVVQEIASYRIRR